MLSLASVKTDTIIFMFIHFVCMNEIFTFVVANNFHFLLRMFSNKVMLKYVFMRLRFARNSAVTPYCLTHSQLPPLSPIYHHSPPLTPTHYNSSSLATTCPWVLFRGSAPLQQPGLNVWGQSLVAASRLQPSAKTRSR